MCLGCLTAVVLQYTLTTLYGMGIVGMEMDVERGHGHRRVTAPPEPPQCATKWRKSSPHAKLLLVPEAIVARAHALLTLA